MGGQRYKEAETPLQSEIGRERPVEREREREKTKRVPEWRASVRERIKGLSLEQEEQVCKRTF